MHVLVDYGFLFQDLFACEGAEKESVIFPIVDQIAFVAGNVYLRLESSLISFSRLVGLEVA